MTGLPCSKKDMDAMLREIGAASIEALFSGVPDSIHCKEPLNLPPAHCEADLLNEFRRISDANKPCLKFLGAGAYPHLIPSILDHFMLRSEFYTAYTPYQPEVSQGTLQAIFEYQTLMSLLTGMEIANASLYDGATSLVEGMMMAVRITKRQKIVVSKAVHPEYRRVLKTYMKNLGVEIQEIPVRADGKTDFKAVEEALSGKGAAAFALQSPNFYGVIEELGGCRDMAQSSGSLFVALVTEGISLGLLKPPGEFGADIVVGEGQSFGLPLNFGGPYLGFIATKEKYMRSLPGRIVGETRDAEGRRGFVITLATREQHIRREKATSNICTNESLCALAASIYLTTLGKEGLREVALRCFEKAEFLKSKIRALKGVSLKYGAPTFHEFVVELPRPAEAVFGELLKSGLVCGLPLGTYEPELSKCVLLCCTEVHSRKDMERLVTELGRVL